MNWSLGGGLVIGGPNPFFDRRVLGVTHLLKTRPFTHMHVHHPHTRRSGLGPQISPPHC